MQLHVRIHNWVLPSSLCKTIKHKNTVHSKPKMDCIPPYSINKSIFYYITPFALSPSNCIQIQLNRAVFFSLYLLEFV